MKKIVVGVLLLILGMVGSSGAQNIHVRYFESADVLLVDRSFQILSLATLQDEDITLVAYGLDEDLAPTLTVFDSQGLTIAENLNPQGLPVVSLTWRAEGNELYTFLLARQGEAAGLMRVMAFEGDPLSGDLSFLDTVDPLLPSRAYLVAGDTEQPIRLGVQIVPEEGSEVGPEATIYASRGTEISLPTADERAAAVQQAAWENDRGDIFYTLNVRALPETSLTSSRLGGQLRRAAQFLDTLTIQIDLGQGGGEASPLEFLSRPICSGQVGSPASLLAGPGSDYRALGSVSPGQEVELIGENGDFYLILDATNPKGGSWIPKAALSGINTGGLDCSRVLPFPAPILDETTAANQTGGGGNGGTNPLAGLPPLEDGPSDSPGPDDPGIIIPPPPPPGDEQPKDNPSNLVASYIACTYSYYSNYSITVSYTGGVGNSFTLSVGGDNDTEVGTTPNGSILFFIVSGSLGGSVSGGFLSDGVSTVPVSGAITC